MSNSTAFHTPEISVPVNKKLLGIGLLLTLVLQLGVLGTEYLSSTWPLKYGEPVLLKTEPIDPRSLFRGNYVRLNYGISRVDAALAVDPFRKHQTVFVTLKQEGKYHVAERLLHEPPEQGPVIRGRIRWASDQFYRIDYGIEAFFMPKGKAIAAQNAVREKEAWAQIYLLDSGKAAIADLICEGGCL
ncbi:GDYXXLXY domain-containing protein [Marinobacterium mangrovicola]|uniref:Putative membrane-anchored protein n=1 Tax=Marinobacterium mangrovicola TaxID=1476959 RepID=A0A4R1GBI2_9GAMM|nr:GDYXXLXY domain-containing protein [Marinobacterium mangrovicola]TCK04081.1 putative membrane-anchored protein [Marinobacterium mangrovicola]